MTHWSTRTKKGSHLCTGGKGVTRPRLSQVNVLCSLSFSAIENGKVERQERAGPCLVGGSDTRWVEWGDITTRLVSQPFRSCKSMLVPLYRWCYLCYLMTIPAFLVSMLIALFRFRSSEIKNLFPRWHQQGSLIHQLIYRLAGRLFFPGQVLPQPQCPKTPENTDSSNMARHMTNSTDCLLR